MQSVQQKLKDNEKTNKLDASPVTIADYGERLPEIPLLHAHVPSQYQSASVVLRYKMRENYEESYMLHN